MSVLAISEAEVIEDGWALLDRAERLAWPEEGYKAISDAAETFRDSVRFLEDLMNGGWDRSASTEGCTQGVARDITEQGEALAVVIGKHMGDEAAAKVRGQDKGES